jgi:serine/alanine racemase
MGFGDTVAIIPCVARQAVPFFFMVSGFFYAKKDWKKKDSLSLALKNTILILLIYAVWIVFWLPSIISDTKETYANNSVIFIIAVVLRRVFLAGIAPYWYLLALAEGSFILALILNYEKLRIGWILCIVGLALNVIYGLKPASGIGGLIFRVFYTVFSWENNFIMVGFPLLFLGAMASRWEYRIASFKHGIITILYLSVSAAAFFVYSLNKQLFGIPFGIIQGGLLFLICIMPSRHEERIDKKICSLSRNLSSVVFLTHTAFLTLIGKVLHIWDPYLRFFLTVAGCIIVLIITMIMNNRVINRLLLIKLPKKRKPGFQV